MQNAEKIVKHTLKILRGTYREILEVCSSIFQNNAQKV